MIELARALRAVVESLERAQLPYLVVGSTAAAAWGVARTTRDVDLVTLTAAVGLDGALETLDASGFYVPWAEARSASRAGGSFNVIDPDGGGKVDVFVALASDDYTRARLARRVRATVLGVDCWVATPEDVVLAKLRWRLESRSEVPMARLRRGRIDQHARPGVPR
jgi:hypothetical protein